MAKGSWKTRLAAVSLAAVALTGCYSVEFERGEGLGKNVEEHVLISNYGWRLLCCVPVICGNANTDSWCPISLFWDDLDPEIAYEKLVARAKEKNCNLQDVEICYDDDVMCDWLLDIPVPWILPYYEVRISANLVKKGGVK